MRAVRLWVALTVAGLGAAGLAVATPAQAKTLNACVKKSNGSVTFLNKKNKKCKKGWVKISWNAPGAAGPQGSVGPVGPNWRVVDSAGNTLGSFGGTYFGGFAFPFQLVILSDGGVVMYRADGILQNDNSSLVFVNNGCTDAAWFGPTNQSLGPYLRSAGGPGRAAFHVTNAPTASAWRVAETTTSTVPVPANSLFQKNPTTGACAAATHAAGFIVPLTPAEAPKVANGSLRVVR
jgi:hypothetical protein